MIPESRLPVYPPNCLIAHGAGTRESVGTKKDVPKHGGAIDKRRPA